MAGMFDFLPQPTYRDLYAQEDIDERQNREVAKLGLGDMAAYAAGQGGRMVGTGLGQLAGAALGVDTRPPAVVKADAIEKVKAQVAQDMGGIDPNDPKFADKFYPAVIRALIAQKLPFEAAQVQKEYKAQKIAETKAETGASAASAKAVNDAERNAIARDRLKKMGPEILQLMDRFDELQKRLLAGNPSDEGYKTMEIAADQLVRLISDKVRAAGGKVQVSDAGDRLVVLDAQGNTVREINKGAKPMSEDQRADNARAEEKQREKEEKDKQGKTLTATQVTNYANTAYNLQRLVQQAGKFRADFSGDAFAKLGTAIGMEDQVQMAKRLFGDNRDAVAWWEDYARTMTALRKALYGATLTAGEKSAFAQIKANLGDNPEQVMRTIKEQADAAAQELEVHWTAQKNAGYNVDGLEKHVKASMAAAEAAPLTPQPAPGKSAARPAAAPAAPAARKPLDLNAYRK